jgi:MFS family permease
VITPLLTSGIWFAVGPVWAVLTGAICALIGTVLFRRRAKILGVNSVAMHGSGGSEAADPAPRSAVLSRNGLAVLAPMLALGTVMGSLSVGFPAWALDRGFPEFSGVLMALGSVGGVMGGLVYGRLSTEGQNLWVRYCVATMIMVVATALVALSVNLPLVVFASLLTGVSLTPMFIIAFLLVGIGFSKERHTEVNASVSSAYNLGSGLAALGVGAVIVEWGVVKTLMIVAAAVAVLGFTPLLGVTVREGRREGG